MIQIDGKDTVAKIDRLVTQVKEKIKKKIKLLKFSISSDDQRISGFVWDGAIPNRNICSRW